MTTRDDDFVPQERASLLTWKIARGEEFTTTEVAESFGLTYQGGRRLLHTISRVIPISVNSSGVWRRFDIS